MSSVSAMSCSSVAPPQLNPIIHYDHWSGGKDNYKILKRHKLEYTQLLIDAIDENRLPKVLALIIADFVVDGEVFDRQGWLEYYGVDIGPETGEVQEALKFDHFYKTYHAPHPVDIVENVAVDKIRQVCESCLTPTVRPQTVKRLESGLRQDFCHIILNDIAKNPIKGYAAKYFEKDLKPLLQYGMIKAGPSALVIMLKGVVARNRPWSNESQDPKDQGQIQYLRNLNEKTGFGCRPPDALSQNAVIFAHHVLTKEYPLGNCLGIEGTWTNARTIEQIKCGQYNFYQMISGFFDRKLQSDHTQPGELTVSQSNLSSEDVGVVVLR